MSCSRLRELRAENEGTVVIPFRREAFPPARRSGGARGAEPSRAGVGRVERTLDSEHRERRIRSVREETAGTRLPVRHCAVDTVVGSSIRRKPDVLKHTIHGTGISMAAAMIIAS